MAEKNQEESKMAEENQVSGSDVSMLSAVNVSMEDDQGSFTDMTEINGVWKHDWELTDTEISDEYDDVERDFMNGQIDRETRDEEYDALDRRFCKIQADRYGVQVKPHRQLLQELELEEKEDQEESDESNDE